MSSKIAQRIPFILLQIVSMAVMWLVLYFVYYWLSGYSLALAYLANILFIILIIVIDEFTIKQLESSIKLSRGKTKEEREKDYQIIKKSLNNSVSFKTDLYLIYVFVLIASQVLAIYPGLVGEELSSFIHANNYSILLLIALDMLSRQFGKDKKRIKEISDSIDKSMSEDKDKPTDIE